MRTERLLSLVLAVLALAVGPGCIRSPQQREAKFLENGKGQMLRKDYARAVLQFRNAVQAMPRDAEAHYQLALAYLGTRDAVAAVASLKKATELNPAHINAQVKLAEIMGLSGLKDVAEEGRKRMQGVLQHSPDNVEALDALALNELRLGKWQDAQAHLQQAFDKAPQNIKSAMALASVDLHRHDLKGAEQALKKAVTYAPQSAEAVTALGEFYMMTGQWTEAENQFQAALKIDPRFPPGLIGLASVQVRFGRRSEAEQTYRLLSGLPETQYRHLYAAYLFNEGKRESAIAEFEKQLQQEPGNRDARTRLVAAYQLANRAQDAERVLNAALKRNPIDADALLQRSQFLLRSGRRNEAERDLNQVLHFRPDSAPAHYLLANTYRSPGDQLRRQELEEAVRYDRAFLEARIQLAQELLETDSARAALATLDAAPDQQKRILALVIQRNWTLLTLDNQIEVRKWLDLALRVAPRSPELFTQDAVLKLKSRDYSGARASAGDALQQSPEDVRALRILAETYVAQKQPAEAQRAIQDYAARHPMSAPIQQFLGEWLFANGKMDQARAAFSAAKAVNRDSMDMALARVDIAEGKLDEARKKLTGVLASNSADSEPHLWLGSIEVKAGNNAAAIDQFRKALEADNRNVVALNNLAYLLSNSADQTNEALKFAEKAHELAPDNADTAGTLGWILYRKGVYNTALKYLEEAVAKDGASSSQNAAIRKYHLAMIYLKVGDTTKGLKTLDAAVRINPDIQKTESIN
jgi:tetratricopeptide (TPR) repeat protein